MAHAVTIGVDLAEILGDVWRAPKVGWCRVSECGMGKRCSLPGRLGGPRERCELPQRGPGRAENGFWRILKVTELSFCI